MPYVWVDPSELDCDGECQTAEHFRDVIRDALKAAKAGDMIGTVRTLGEAIGDLELKRERDKENELRRLYQEWLLLPIPRVEFLTFAHRKRKHTAA